MAADAQSPKMDERRWILRGQIHGLDSDECVEVVPVSLVDELRAERDTLRDAIGEIAEARSFAVVRAICANGPLATAPGGEHEDECARLAAERDALRAEVERLRGAGKLVAEDAFRTKVAYEKARDELADRTRERDAAEGDMCEISATLDRAEAEVARLTARVEEWKHQAAENADQAERAVRQCERLAARSSLSLSQIETLGRAMAFAVQFLNQAEYDEAIEGLRALRAELSKEADDAGW